MGFESSSPLENGHLTPERRQDLASAWRAALWEAVEDRPSFSIEALAQGGEHLVFTYPDHPRLVGKVPVRAFETYLQEPDMTPAEAVSRIEKYLHDLRQARAELREYFGARSLLPEHYQGVPVPITRMLIAELLHMHEDDVPEHVVNGDRWVMPVRVQWRLRPEEGDIDCAFTYLEKFPTNDARAILLADPLEIASDVSLAEIFLDSCTEIPWRDLADDQRDVLRDFLQRCADYSLHTGKILDLAGGANVLLRSADASPKMLLIDPLAGTGSLFNEFVILCDSSAEIADWNDHDLNVVANVGGYLRLIAALSAILDVTFPFERAMQSSSLDWSLVLTFSHNAFRRSPS